MSDIANGIADRYEVLDGGGVYDGCADEELTDADVVRLLNRYHRTVPKKDVLVQAIFETLESERKERKAMASILKEFVRLHFMDSHATPEEWLSNFAKASEMLRITKVD